MMHLDSVGGIVAIKTKVLVPFRVEILLNCGRCFLNFPDLNCNVRVAGSCKK